MYILAVFEPSRLAVPLFFLVLEGKSTESLVFLKLSIAFLSFLGFPWAVLDFRLLCLSLLWLSLGFPCSFVLLRFSLVFLRFSVVFLGVPWFSLGFLRFS